jgi:hypothetical protein
MFASSQQSKSEPTGEEVQGQEASDLEWRVAVALDKLKIPYMFQFSIAGGHMRRGGVVLDFLALIPPLSVPIEVMGGYWHTASMKAEDKLKEAIVRQQGTYAEMVYLFEGELATIADAYSAVKRELRV